MLLVLWTLYSVSALAFRAVSTKSCGVFFCVLGRNLQFWNFEKRGKQGKHFPCFPGLVITILPEYLFVFFFVCFFYVGLKFVIFGILKSGRTGRTFSLFSQIGYNGLPELLCSVRTGVDRGACSVLRLLGITDLFL